MPKTSNLKQVHNNIRELKWLEEPIDIPEFSECLPNKKFYRSITKKMTYHDYIKLNIYKLYIYKGSNIFRSQ